ncbi:hypothetical protein HN51_005658, partial [Arachis hypogaea]
CDFSIEKQMTNPNPLPLSFIFLLPLISSSQLISLPLQETSLLPSASFRSGSRSK